MLKLVRTGSCSDGTFGMMWEDGKPSFLTLEPVIPIIPKGKYSCYRYMSPKRGYEVYMLKNVPGHTAVEIHIGNYVTDTEGCILIGNAVGMVGRRLGISGSKVTFTDFMGLHRDDIDLVVS